MQINSKRVLLSYVANLRSIGLLIVIVIVIVIVIDRDRDRDRDRVVSCMKREKRNCGAMEIDRGRCWQTGWGICARAN